jgi:hypothetical protein
VSLVSGAAARHHARMPMIATTVTARVAAAQEPLFEWFIPIELPRILVGWGPIPAVVASTDQSGPWDRPGSQRTVHLADGHTAREQVTACERPTSFGYTVTTFSNALRHLASEGRGEWWFTPASADTTDVRWTYTFVARSRLAGLVLLPVVKLAWRGYMRRGLDRLAELARDEAGDGVGVGIGP